MRIWAQVYLPTYRALEKEMTSHMLTYRCACASVPMCGCVQVGPDYKKRGKKEPSESSMFRQVSLDWYKCDAMYVASILPPLYLEVESCVARKEYGVPPHGFPLVLDRGGGGWTSHFLTAGCE